MAVTKFLKPIKKTIHKAIKYIANDKKTNNQNLVSYGYCSEKSVTNDFLKDHQKLKYSPRKNSILAHHLIQSFNPNDNITPEQAHEIGLKMCKEFFQDSHKFVLATHVEKDHIHNHIIFNAPNFKTKTKFVFKGRNDTHNRISEISDRLCRENNLHVIENPKKAKGMKRNEYEYKKTGNSYKQNLKNTIDRVLQTSLSYEQFLKQMENEGYKNNTHTNRKYLTFYNESEMARPIRIKNFGTQYEKENIIKKISEVKAQGQKEWKKFQNSQKVNFNKVFTSKRISLRNSQILANLKTNLSNNFKTNEISLSMIDNKINLNLIEINKSYSIIKNCNFQIRKYKNIIDLHEQYQELKNIPKFERDPEQQQQFLSSRDSLTKELIKLNVQEDYKIDFKDVGYLTGKIEQYEEMKKDSYDNLKDEKEQKNKLSIFRHNFIQSQDKAKNISVADNLRRMKSNDFMDR